VRSTKVPTADCIARTLDQIAPQPHTSVDGENDVRIAIRYLVEGSK
jgi:hypothetical protein